MVILLIVGGILLELIILVVGICIGLRYLKKLPSPEDRIEVKVSGGKTITSEVVRDGVKNAIREISYEDELEKSLQKKKFAAEQVYSSSPKDEPVRHSGGNLVPYGLTDSEKTVLEMFYEKD